MVLKDDRKRLNKELAWWCLKLQPVMLQIHLSFSLDVYAPTSFCLEYYDYDKGWKGDKIKFVVHALSSSIFYGSK
jgi:hypothetical protein